MGSVERSPVVRVPLPFQGDPDGDHGFGRLTHTRDLTTLRRPGPLHDQVPVEDELGAVTDFFGRDVPERFEIELGKPDGRVDCFILRTRHDGDPQGLDILEVRCSQF